MDIFTQHWEKSKLCNFLNLRENIGLGFKNKPLVSIPWEILNQNTINLNYFKTHKELVTNKQFYGQSFDVLYYFENHNFESYPWGLLHVHIFNIDPHWWNQTSISTTFPIDIGHVNNEKNKNQQASHHVMYRRRQPPIKGSCCDTWG